VAPIKAAPRHGYSIDRGCLNCDTGEGRKALQGKEDVDDHSTGKDYIMDVLAGASVFHEGLG